MKQEVDAAAKALWEDTIEILKTTTVNPSIISMTSSCCAERIEDDLLIISTPAKFVKQTLEKNSDVICACISDAAFQPMGISIRLIQQQHQHQSTTVDKSKIPFYKQPETREEFSRVSAKLADPMLPFIKHMAQTPHQLLSDNNEFTFNTTITQEEFEIIQDNSFIDLNNNEKIQLLDSNSLIEEISYHDSKLTFDTFIQGEENQFAAQAAKQVADGDNHTFNPLFIHSSSGLGKTHLLKAIQNYISHNCPHRLCVYKVASDFISDYVTAMQSRDKDQKSALERSYQNIDVLIIDDIQLMKEAQGSIKFFFDTFNHLTRNGKQIVVAADEPPIRLGMEERVTSRLDSGVTVSIQAPNYELKLALITNFYKQMKEENLHGHQGKLTEENLKTMASKSGDNIRLIKAFCQSCLYTAGEKAQKGEFLTDADILTLAKRKWLIDERTVSVDDIQQLIEKTWSISHNDLVGDRRNKELMEPRHIAIWLCRQMTDSTLAEIGKHFGGRSHATIKHSISWVDEEMKSRIFFDKIEHLKSRLSNL